MKAYLSEKLKILSLISMLVIVYAHGYNLTTRFSDNAQTVKQFDVNSFVQELLSEPGGIGRVTPPLFFLLLLKN